MAKAFTKQYPTKEYEIERVLEDGVRCEVALYDLSHIEEITTHDSIRNVNDTQYVVNKYVVELFNQPAYIEANYQSLLSQAKADEFEKLSAEIRTKRDKLLAETDWTQVADNQLSNADKEKYRVYRQALRDIPEQAGFPYEVVFPKL